jgi:peptidoglycan/xylan/chitin deacetylase (PgdA/CDA1 family)
MHPRKIIRDARKRWGGSYLRGSARRWALNVLATVPPPPRGLVHIFLHGVPSNQAARLEDLLDDLQEIGPVVGLEASASPSLDADAPRFCLSFDDGYKSTVIVAGPILRRRGLPATLFVPSGFVGLEGKELQTYMREGLRWHEVYEPVTTDDIRCWVDWGFSIGSHSVTHRPFSELSPDEARWELEQSKNTLEEVARTKVQYFAWPFGRRSYFPGEYVRLALECGYSRVYSAVPRSERATLPDGALPRRAISLEWSRRICRYFLRRG